MACFVVEGTTLVGWTQLVRAETEDQAAAAARGGIAAVATLGSDLQLADVRHRVTRCRRLPPALGDVPALPGRPDETREPSTIGA